MSAATPLAPYRALFPIGAAFAVAGAAPWIFHAAGAPGYPAALHRSLMIQGFEMSFVLGFLLTSIPAFTHGAPCRSWELASAVAGQLLFGTFAVGGFEAASQVLFCATLALLMVAAARRVARAEVLPPEELLFVGVGLGLGLAGGVTQLGVALDWWQEPSPRLGAHLLSLGMMLSLVLGVGSMLVPVFAGVRDPLVLPGIAGPHERGRRRLLYAALAALLVLSFVSEATHHLAFGAWLRFGAAVPLGLLGWKLHRRPGRRALLAWTLWASGWSMLLGLGLAATFPARAIAFEHLVFVGGYGMLTLAIATRVVTGHGRHPVSDEGRMVTSLVVSLVAAALALRLAAEVPDWRSPALAAGATAWIVAWIAWAVNALPRLAPAAAGARPPSRAGASGAPRNRDSNA